VDRARRWLCPLFARETPVTHRVFAASPPAARRAACGNGTGDFFLDGLKCGGTFDRTAQIVPQAGRFQRGLSATVGCNRVGCNFYQTLDTVRLRTGRND
jgi:hypothetical protein